MTPVIYQGATIGCTRRRAISFHAFLGAGLDAKFLGNYPKQNQAREAVVTAFRRSKGA